MRLALALKGMSCSKAGQIHEAEIELGRFYWNYNDSIDALGILKVERRF